MSPYQSCNRQRMEWNMARKSEIRNPKSERSPKAEIRNRAGRGSYSFGLRISDFGFRISFNGVTVPTPCGDQLVSQLLAQVGDMYVQQIRQRAVVFVEQMLVKHRAGHNFTAMQRQILQERILPSSKRNRCAGL